jgi:hypothetical protein
MKFKLLLAAILVALLSPLAPAQASPSAYTYVQRIPGASGSIQIKCHNSAGWTSLPVGAHSRTYCGSNGWVDSIRNPTSGALYAKNINTGNVTVYGRNYQGPIGGGYYNVYLSDFCGGCGSGGGGGGKVLNWPTR